ncbi:hypothetical protein [Streptomyces cyaneofuscatus]|uniref:hypothetical protein n=1 Tax=Streptomyces cyaneofuscatus TaxID=66883 RepID=UPI00364B6EEF
MREELPREPETAHLLSGAKVSAATFAERESCMNTIAFHLMHGRSIYAGTGIA